MTKIPMCFLYEGTYQNFKCIIACSRGLIQREPQLASVYITLYLQAYSTRIL